MSEWPFVLLALISALAFLMIGVTVAFMTHQPYWLNRFGALIVASEGLIMTAELRQERRLHGLQEIVESKRGDKDFLKAVSVAIAEAKWSVVRTGLSLAVFGELVHGFGDVALSWLFDFPVGSH